MSIISKLAKSKEKNVLLNLFGGSESENESSDDESGIENQKRGVDGEDELLKPRESSGEETIQFELECEDRVTIELIQRKQLGIAFQLWPAASLLAEHIISHPQLLHNESTSTRVNLIELGAGLGLSGMYICKYFSLYSAKLEVNKVILTDLPEVMPILTENISRNSLSSNVSCYPLDWNTPSQASELLRIHFDSEEIKDNPPIIIAADVVYWECLFQPLINTLEVLCQQGCKVIMSHIKRWKKDQKFFQFCRKRNLLVDTLLEKIETLPHEHTGEPTKQISRIYLIHYDNNSITK